MFSSNTSQVSNDAVFVEDVMSTFLYTGNGSTQTITNGIDLSTKGGLVWAKMRSNGSTTGHVLSDTARGPSQKLDTSSTGASSNWTPYGISAFGSTGFTVADDGAGNYVTNNSGVNYASWTFRKQPKFFDVVTWTGNNTSGRTIAHNLGAVPGCIIVKSSSAATVWAVYHSSIGATNYLRLNTTDASTANSTMWNNTAPTSTEFTVGNAQATNQTGTTYVAYLFAHNAGGFGLTGTDNVISCGSYVGTEASLPITLGYEPQWVMIKDASVGGTYKDWYIFDNMRKLDVSNSGNAPLRANTSGAEGGTYASSAYNLIQPTSTGMIIDPSSQGPSAVNQSGSTYIYIAIRRGPMKVPTTGTSVFTPSTVGATNNITVGFPADTAWFRYTGSDNWRCFDRLRSGFELATNLTDAEGTYNYSPTYIHWDSNSVWNQNLQNGPVVDYFFRRAPSFFDEVCYTGTGSNMTISHNLGVVPELMIVKMRSTATFTGYWYVYASGTGNTKYGLLSLTNSFSTSSGAWNNTTPTASSFYVGTDFAVSETGKNFVAYLFATCPGVSKCFNYTGNGSSQTINCGFTGGARWILIKRTDSTGDWYVWDSARGIVSGNDPHLSLNSTAAEVTSDDTIDTDSTGFVVNQVSATNVNVSSATYIGIAIA